MKDIPNHFQNEYIEKNALLTLRKGKIVGVLIILIYSILFLFGGNIQLNIPEQILLYFGLIPTLLFLGLSLTQFKIRSKHIIHFYGLMFLGVSISLSSLLYLVFTSHHINENTKFLTAILLILIFYIQSVFSFGLRRNLFYTQIFPLLIALILIFLNTDINTQQYLFLSCLPLFLIFIFIENKKIERNNYKNFCSCFKVDHKENELIEEIEKRKKAEEKLKKHQDDLKQLVELRTHGLKEKSAELEAAKVKAEEADRLKTAFMATMSHELRTPLNAIIGFTELLDEDSTKEEVIEYNDIINKSGLRLLNTVEDIFQLTYIETKEVKLFKEELNLNRLIKGLISEYEILKQDYHKSFLKINFKTDVKDDDCNVITDSKRLKIIFDKLVNNAIKFTKNGAIEVGYSPGQENDDTQDFLFFVKDTGIGIAQEFHQVIFERFRQVEESNTRNYEGSGLGVTIANELSKLLGGKMWVESEIDKGSTFHFQLPLEIAGKKKETPKELVDVRKSIPDYSGKRILIAEDTESNFKLLEQYLKKTKIEIIWAMDGLEAVEFCKQDSDIDLVLMDMKMPNMNGYEATMEIKKAGFKNPVIAQTAYALQDDEVKTFTAGCDDYLSKPIKKRELFNSMNKYFFN